MPTISTPLGFQVNVPAAPTGTAVSTPLGTITVNAGPAPAPAAPAAAPRAIQNTALFSVLQRRGLTPLMPKAPVPNLVTPAMMQRAKQISASTDRAVMPTDPGEPQDNSKRTLMIAGIGLLVIGGAWYFLNH